MAEDFFKYRCAKDTRGHLSWFADDLATGHKMGETADSCLRSDTVVGKLPEQLPNACFIKMSKNPIEREWSMRAQALKCRNDHVANYSKGSHLSDVREAASDLLENGCELNVMPYSEFSGRGLSLRRSLQPTPSAEVTWRCYEDFAAVPFGFHRVTLIYLDVAYDGLEEFLQISMRKLAWSRQVCAVVPSEAVRSRGLHRCRSPDNRINANRRHRQRLGLTRQSKMPMISSVVERFVV